MARSPGPKKPERTGHRSQIQALESQVEELHHYKELLEERFRFEKLLSEISSVFTNLPTSEIDETIKYGLEQIGRFLDVDRFNLLQFTGKDKNALIHHSWVNKGIPPLPELPELSTIFPWLVDRMLHGQTTIYSRIKDFPADAAVDKKTFNFLGVKSILSVPISVGGSIVGALTAVALRTNKNWPEELVQQLSRAGEVFANAVARKEKDLKIQSAFEEIKRLKEQTEADYVYLREEIDLEYNFQNIVGKSIAFKNVLFKIQQIAPADTTVLILGETGTGKEPVARALHDASNRKNRPLVKVNCAALPANLIESELFGHEKGAFTSAQARQIGRFELADKSSLFLDEIGELPMESQAKLLRVLQDGEFERLGSAGTIKVDVRIIAASNRNLEQEVKKGRFRQDLYYRLNVFPILMPPLRDRLEDIPLLVNLFINRFNRKLGKKIERIPADVMKVLQDYDWPGNVRELENVIERAAVNSRTGSLELMDRLIVGKNESAPAEVSMNTEVPPDPEASLNLDEAQRKYIIKALKQTGGRIDGPTGAALLLGINPSTLRNRMKKLGIRKQLNFS